MDTKTKDPIDRLKATTVSEILDQGKDLPQDYESAKALEKEINRKLIQLFDSKEIKDFLDKKVDLASKKIARAIKPDRNHVVVSVKGTTRDPISVGVQHKNFEVLLKLVAAGENTFLVGPAGTGKTSAAKAISKALGFRFFAQSVCSQTTKADMLGYKNHAGDFVETDFYRAYSGGGVFLLDEIDNGNANVLAALNAALDNGICSFACGLVPMHPEFRCIAAANTYGSGADRMYVGRNQLDAATLDRFAFLDWPVDEKLEVAIAGDGDWSTSVRIVRQAVAEAGIRHIVSPRASIKGMNLLNAGLDPQTVADMVVWKGLDGPSRTKVLSKIPSGIKIMFK